MFPGGHCPDVGLGGFVLQGGMGWNCKVSENLVVSSARPNFTVYLIINPAQNWGFACEKLLAVDVVTADGKQLHCNEAENSELLWAARGAGPGK
jgi:FAD/FMN-containing dehydrogenase